MKHQYFGDVSDYKKYGVLRSLTSNGKVKLLVCWMLTPKDLRKDGNKNTYLHDADKWRSHEPDLFDFLYNSVIKKRIKDLSLVEKHNIVPQASYFNEVLHDSRSDREGYFRKLYDTVADYDLVFFDPDNGIATGSMLKGRKNSSKYVFWDEIETIWNKGHSLLIYQHFPRVNRLTYIQKLWLQMKERLNVSESYAIKTTFMVYFLIVQEEHKALFTNIEQAIKPKWHDQIDILHLKH